jgi:hypothetical protein
VLAVLCLAGLLCLCAARLPVARLPGCVLVLRPVLARVVAGWLACPLACLPVLPLFPSFAVRGSPVLLRPARRGLGCRSSACRAARVRVPAVVSRRVGRSGVSPAPVSFYSVIPVFFEFVPVGA